MGFFEVISASAPHIYHSALLLSPTESIVKTLYGPQVEPMARVVQGIPALWDPSIANIRFPGEICTAAWSPCSRLIAVAHNKSSLIVILDAMSLEQLHTMHPPQDGMLWSYITFSPGSHLLTAYAQMRDSIVNWDLQTGGLLSQISTWEYYRCDSVSYSGCETMIGSSFSSNTIVIYSVLSGTRISSHSIQSPIVGNIWTCGEYFWFATVESSFQIADSRSIIMWQVGFTSSHSPTKVDSLSTPNQFFSSQLVLLPTLSRLAFILGGEVLVWDAQHHKLLLHSAEVENPRAMSFSPDGHFFVCGTEGREFYIWKESPTGYISNQRLVSGANGTTPYTSPSGESVISSGDRILQLWPTTSPPTTSPSISTQASQHSGWFFVEFSPDESLVAVAERLGATVTVLDTKSGNTCLIIDTNMKACGLRITEDKVIVVGDGKIVTWNLPARDCLPNTGRNINDSVHTTTFKHFAHISGLCASISPNLNYLVTQGSQSVQQALCIYNTHTGEKLTDATSSANTPGFTPNGHEVWCARDSGQVYQWKIVRDGPHAVRLEELGINVEPLSGVPWLSPYGYQVTDDGWILCSSGKWLMWLPHHWRQDEKIQRKWNGKFLTVWNRSLPKPCILELKV